MRYRQRARQQSRQPFPVVGLLFLLNLLFPITATSGEILLSAVGNGQWQISATGLANVHALDLDLRYDAQRLSGLTVSTGAGLSGVMTAINSKVPGVLRLGGASTQPLPQSGILVNLRSTMPGADLVVTSFTVKAVDNNGQPLPTTLRQQLSAQSPPPQIPLDNQAEDTTTPQSQTVTRQRGSAASASVTLPAGIFPNEEKEELTPPLPPSTSIDQDGAAETISSSLTAPPAISGAEKRFHSQEEIVTVIERLPQPWTVAAIKAIFLQPATSKLARQQPPVVLADGRSKVYLYLPKSLSQVMPSVGVQGCTLGSIRDAGEQGWEVEFITRQGIWPAKALLLGDGDLIQFPIVIVPALDITPPESDDATIPSIDFDGDSSITAFDAYLYVGNLLAQ